MTPRIIRVSPSIIAINYNDDATLENALQNIQKAGANMVHLDVMDGVFVKNKTFDHTFIDKIKDKTNLLLDVHLMVSEPEKVVDNYIDAGADIITIHFEATKDPLSLLKYIKSRNIVAGLALSPETPVLKVKDILESNFVDIVVVMGVKPGAYGQKFIPGSAEKIAEVREFNKKAIIEIDGGVTIKNSAILRKMGVNIIVSGATIFESKNIKKTIKQLKGKGWLNNLREHFNTF